MEGSVMMVWPLVWGKGLAKVCTYGYTHGRMAVSKSISYNTSAIG